MNAYEFYEKLNELYPESLSSPWDNDGIMASCGGATEIFRVLVALDATESAVNYAAENGFDWFCSTLTLSRHKDPLRINALGEAFAEEYGVRWLPSEFKKRGRELRSRQLCDQYGIYRQNYCGCCFSLRTSESAEQNNKRIEDGNGIF